MTVAQLVKQGYLTKKQGAKLPSTYALKVGNRNKKKNHKPKPSLPKDVWARKVAERRKNKGKGKK